jgi:hypothetical protein
MNHDRSFVPSTEVGTFVTTGFRPAFRQPQHPAAAAANRPSRPCRRYGTIATSLEAIQIDDQQHDSRSPNMR